MEGIFSNSENYLNAFILETGDGIQSLIGLLANSPEYPQRIRVASVFEPIVCLLD